MPVPTFYNFKQVPHDLPRSLATAARAFGHAASVAGAGDRAVKMITGAWAMSCKMHVLAIKRCCHSGCPGSEGSGPIMRYLVRGRIWHQLALPRGLLGSAL